MKSVNEMNITFSGRLPLSTLNIPAIKIKVHFKKLLLYHRTEFNINCNLGIVENIITLYTLTLHVYM